MPKHPLLDPEVRMSLVEHLTELRSRLLKCTIAVFVLGIVALIFARPLFGMLMRPVLDALPPENRALVYTSGIEEINVLMKVGVYGGIFLTTPVILWQIWGFVSPGLYDEEKKYAGPFVLLGSLAFLIGALFCYFMVLPSMFQFLLNEEDSVAIEHRLETGRVRADDALRFLRVGDPERAGQLAKKASDELRADGDGKPNDPRAVPSESVELSGRLAALGQLVDAAVDGFGPPARGVLRQAVERRVAAAEAMAAKDYKTAAAAMDEAASLLAGAAPTHTEEMAGLWKLGKELSAAKAQYAAISWTRPMLTMEEQLSLVLMLILAFGIIFELPLVMALLGIVGLVKSKWLFRYQRHAFVVCLIAAAVITPTGDVVNLSLMAGPMLLCYELGVLAVWVIEKRRAKEEAAADITPAS